MDSSYVSRMVNLTALAPDIVATILDDTVSAEVTLFDLAVEPPVLWEEQGGRSGYRYSERSDDHITRYVLLPGFRRTSNGRSASVRRKARWVGPTPKAEHHSESTWACYDIVVCAGSVSANGTLF